MCAAMLPDVVGEKAIHRNIICPMAQVDHRHRESHLPFLSCFKREDKDLWTTISSRDLRPDAPLIV